MNYETYKQRGFSLIEVMLAVLVLSIGILAVSKLQTSLIRSGSDANHRTVAASIAQRKINDLRRFVYLTTSEISTPIEWDSLTVNSVTSLKYPLSLAFTNIETNKGGRIQAGDILNGNDIYSLRWTSDSYTYPTTNAIAALAGVSDEIAFKRVHVVVEWDGVGNNTNNVVSFDTVVDSYSFTNSDLASTTVTAGTGPQVEYDPLAAPDVIDIDVGNGKLRQTTKPLPTVLGGGDNTVVDFTVVTYSTGGDTFANRKEEFRTVDCKCDLSSTQAYAYPPGHILWDGADRDDNLLPKIEKDTATAASNDSDAEFICEICCRDHHDDDASAIKYVVGTSSGDHDHYNAAGTAVTSGQEYIESCRLKRIDGNFRVFQDWSLKDITVMERASLVDGNQLQTDYVDYQNDFILNSVTTANAITHNKPTLRSPVSMSLNEAAQFEARGVYIDNVYDSNGDENPASYLTHVASASKTDRLEIIPFAEVNLTLLASWSSDMPSTVSVTSEVANTIVDPDNNYYGQYSRGLASALTQLTSANITAAIRDDNHGLTQVTATNPTPTNLSDTVTINVGVAGTPFQITGSFSFSYPNDYPNNPNKGSININVIGAGSCSISGNTYTCDVDAPWDGQIYISVSHPAGGGGPSAYNACSGSSTIYDPVSPISADPIHVFPSFTCS